LSIKSGRLSTLFLFIILFLVGCASPGLMKSPTATVEMPPSQEPTRTLPPATATSLPAVGAFLAAPEADVDLVDHIKPQVSAWVREEGYRFQSLQSLSLQDLERETYSVVVAIAPQTNIASLAQAAPETRFLAVGFSDLDTAQNLSVIPAGKEHYDQQGFMAGYIAAMITPDWRAAAIGVSDHPAAQQAREAFVVGRKYFCGLCRPEHPPWEFPLYVELPQDANAAQWQSTADVMVKKGIETFYVIPGAGGEELVQFLVNANKKILSDGAYYREDYKEGWVASLDFDLPAAFDGYWPTFVDGDAGQAVPVPLTINDVNPENLSPGRLKNARSVLEEVSNGWIQVQSVEK